MSAGFGELRLETRARQVTVRFALENRSDREWTAGEGFCVGWQLFDPTTSLFIAEGDWNRLERGLMPGESAEFTVSIELPAEAGHYHVYVSPRTETEGWHYDREWPFVLVEATVENGVTTLDRAGVTTRGQMRRRHLWTKTARVAWGPVRALWSNRRLIASMTRRDIAARYRGSLGDVLWTVLHPLLLMLTYLFVFGVVLQARFGQDPSRAGFALYFLAGMLPWLPFSEAVARAPTVILDNRNLVKKVVFPVEILPVNPALSGLVSEAFGLVVFLALVLAARGAVPWTAAWLPLLVAPQLMLTLAVCWFLAALGVYLRDLGQVIGFLLTLVFFLTPICYPEASLPAAAVAILDKSPMYMLVRAYRAVLLEAAAPETASLAVLWLGSAAACVLAHAWFRRLRVSFPDVI